MKAVISIITVKSFQHSHPVQSTASRTRILTQTSFPYRICDVSLPQCNTGYDYMIIS